MDLRSTLIWLMKAFVVGIMAFAALCLFCLFFYNIPGRVTATNGMTSYRRTSNFCYSNLTEGFGYGKTDWNGYFNSYDVALDEDYGVLLMGSSHMEGLNVFQDQTAAFLLNQTLTGLDVYNVGISSHNFIMCASYLDSAISSNQPKYIIIETSSVTFSNEMIKSALANEPASIPSYDGGFIYQLQKIPYLRLISKQINDLSANRAANVEQSEDTETEPSQIGELLKKMKETADEKEAILIIFYHPRLDVQKDGDVTANTNADDLRSFSNACAENNIVFIDITSVFLDAYVDDYILPHGFFNSPIGTGHLNAYGHHMIAVELAKVILAIEEKDDGFF